jgi:hypothetical protein
MKITDLREHTWFYFHTLNGIMPKRASGEASRRLPAKIRSAGQFMGTPVIIQKGSAQSGRELARAIYREQS